MTTKEIKNANLYYYFINIVETIGQPINHFWKQNSNEKHQHYQFPQNVEEIDRYTLGGILIDSTIYKDGSPTYKIVNR